MTKLIIRIRLTSRILSDTNLSGHRTISLSTSSLLIVFRNSQKFSENNLSSCSWTNGIAICDTEDTNATNSTPCASFRYFSAIAPAATLPI
jgi:hypothetical protein